jgi:hypothetical protein
MDLKVLAVVLMFCFIVGATAIQNSPIVTYPKSEYATMQGVPVSLDTRQAPYFGYTRIIRRVQYEDGSMELYIAG